MIPPAAITIPLKLIAWAVRSKADAQGRRRQQRMLHIRTAVDDLARMQHEKSGLGYDLCVKMARYSLLKTGGITREELEWLRDFYGH